jgi:hypothetical protein
MEVVVVQLRLNGKKLTKEEVAQQHEHRGFLHFGPYAYTGYRGELPRTTRWRARLTKYDDERMPPILPDLDNSQVTRIAKGSMIIVGDEDPERTMRGSSGTRHVQAWWVRPILQPG